ncbi:MAG: PAS domain-containing protein [Lachnospiraceae bacterium]|jgi:PAS domain S-box-containing protein|nr:PAS domain-containing protein [Lachnospiraceae bacterium]
MEKSVEQDSQLKQLYQLIPSGVGIYDVTGTVISMVYLNDGYYQMIGVSREQRRRYEGTNAINVFHPDDRPGLLAEAAASIRENRVFEYKYRAFISEGCYRWLCIRASHVRLNETTERFYAAYYDINELVLARDKLRESQLMLEETLKHSGTTHFIYFIERHRYETVAIPEQFKSLPAAMDDYPESFIRYVAMPEEDAGRYRQMLRLIDGGAEDADCDVRMQYLGQYSWFHVSCRSVTDVSGHAERAVGTAVMVDRFHDAQSAFREEKRHLHSMQKGLLAVNAFNVTHDLCMDEDNIRPEASIRETALYRELLQTEPELRRQNGETLGPLLSAVSQIPDAGERQQFVLASSHAGMLRLYQNGQREKTLQYRRYVNGRLIWVSTRIALIADPVTGDVLAYFYTSDINDSMMYRKITAGIIDKNYENVAYLDLETNILYRTDSTVNGKIFTPQPYGEAVESALQYFVCEEETETVRQQYDVGNIRAKLQDSPVYSFFYTAKQRAESLPGHPLRHMKSDLYYLDGQKDVIVILQSDVTQVFEQELEQRRNAEAALHSAEEAKTLERIVKNIPAGLIVYRKDAAGIHIQMLNHRMTELTGAPENKFRTGDVMKMIADDVHPDDRRMVEDGLRILFSEKRSFSIEYRNRRVGDGYFWLSAVGQAIRESDGTMTAYVLYSDATEQKRMEEAFDSRLRELSGINPNTLGIFHLDLTGNVVLRSESRGKDIFPSGIPESADAFIVSCNSRVLSGFENEDDRTPLSRERLIAAYQSGKTEITMNFRFSPAEQEELRWATVYVYLVKNPRSGSIEALVCVLDSTEETRSRKIMSRIAEEDYDYFALLDVKKRSIRFVSIQEKERETTLNVSSDYDTDIQNAFPKLMGRAESERCIRALQLDTVLQELAKKQHLSVPLYDRSDG